MHNNPSELEGSGPQLREWLMVAVAFLLPRLLMAGMFDPPMSDLVYYFNRSVQGVDLEKTPYLEFDLEYPPGAYWMMSLPRRLDLRQFTPAETTDQTTMDAAYRDYAATFRWIMFACDLLAAWLLLEAVGHWRPDRRLAAAWGYSLASLMIINLLYDRLDMGIVLLLAIAMYARSRARDNGSGFWWDALAYSALGLGGAYKLFTLIALPFLWLTDLRRERSLIRMLGLASMATLAALLPFAWYYQQAGPAVLKMFTYHAQRPLEIESVYSALALTLSLFGLPVSTEFEFGSQNLISPVVPFLSKVATVLLLGVLGCAAAWSVFRRGGFDRALGDRLAWWCVLAAVTLSKVLSPQYFIFVTPLLVVLVVELATRQTLKAALAGVVVIDALTTAIFPYCWFAVDPQTGIDNGRGLIPNLNLLGCLLVIARDSLLVVLTGWLFVRLWKDARRERGAGLAAAGLGTRRELRTSSTLGN